MNHLNDTGVRPIGDKVMVRRDPRVDRSPGGIWTPDTPGSWPWTGQVLDVGPRVLVLDALSHVWVPDPDVVPGARVLFEPRGSSALIPDDREGGPPEWERVIQLPFDNILGVIDVE